MLPVDFPEICGCKPAASWLQNVTDRVLPISNWLFADVILQKDRKTYVFLSFCYFATLADDLKSTNNRKHNIFGYSLASGWVWLGWRIDTAGSMDEVQNPSEEREQTAALYKTVPWDSIWMQQTFGLSARPLPDEWKTLTNQDEIQTILIIINSIP